LPAVRDLRERPKIGLLGFVDVVATCMLAVVTHGNPNQRPNNLCRDSQARHRPGEVVEARVDRTTLVNVVVVSATAHTSVAKSEQCPQEAPIEVSSHWHGLRMATIRGQPSRKRSTHDTYAR